MNFEEGEVLLINKPLTWTSFDVVNKVRYALKRKTGKRLKVGHAGTLDPLATGLLLICTGKMTKQIESYTGMDKEYTGTFILGATTPSYDSEHAVDATFPIEHITQELLAEAVKGLSGTIQQMPPKFSAIKVDGVVAYNAARQGEEIVLKARQVHIPEFELTRVELPEIDFRVKCSKGTYIRSLAHDFGKALNSGAYLKTLCRTKVGEFSLAEAHSLEDMLKKIEES
ncbi:MAG: tRNA pseudouridine(55) synthase TruB [Chitinophagales bacterium]